MIVPRPEAEETYYSRQQQMVRVAIADTDATIVAMGYETILTSFLYSSDQFFKP